MALRKFVERLTKSVEELDREQIAAFCDAHDLTPMDQIEARRPIRVGGEVRSVTLVPRSGAPSLEVTLSDGRGVVVGVFLGRTKLSGMSPGRRLQIAGVAAKDGKRYLVFNPVYELLA